MSRAWGRWRLRRELSVLFRRFSYAVFMWPAERGINWLYDAFWNRLVSIEKEIDKKKASRVAVYLVYQPLGLSNITFLTIEALRLAGYSVLIVSNAKLRLDDASRLSAKVAAILVRPNYGVDFGGYRDGVLHLWKYKKSIDEILFLNDSVFCLCGNLEKFFSKIKNSPEDVISAVELQGGQSANAVLTSYFITFRRDALKSRLFWEFWRSYRMANSRYVTVRRGERALSRMVKSSSFSSRGMVSADTSMVSIIDAMSIEDLRQVVRYCALTDESFFLLIERSLDCSKEHVREDQRSFLSRFVLTVARRRSPVASFPYLAHVILEMPVQKKGSTLLQRLALCRVADGINDGVVTDLDPVMLFEVSKLRNLYLMDKDTSSIYMRLVRAARAI